LVNIKTIIRTTHYLELTKKPYSNTYVNLGKRYHSLYRNIIIFPKNVVKLDEKGILY